MTRQLRHVFFYVKIVNKWGCYDVSIFSKAISRWRDPDMVLPLTTNVSNYVYFDPNGKELDMFQDTSKFIAREFTKVKVTITDGTPNRDQLNYLLNLRPNSEQTANELLFEFAYSILRSGQVWYKVVSSPKMTTAIYVSRVAKNGYKRFTAKQLKLQVPSTLIEQYADLVSTLSTQHSSNVMEIQSAIKTDDAGNKSGGTEYDAKVRNRLQRIQNNMREFGMFITNPNEATKDHANLTQPDGTALEDLRNMIYQQLHISPKLLDGSYSESDYRAFYATHLQPMAAALEELLNSELLTREQYLTGNRIEVILDLLQFATLESFTKMAKEALYSGYLTYDEVRRSLGKESYPDGIGQIVFSNKNAVALNNDDINNLLQTGGTSNATTENTGDTSNTN